MGNDSELSIIVRAKNEATKVLNAVRDDANRLGKSLSDNFNAAKAPSAALLASVTAVGVGVAAFAKSSVDAYMEAEQASAQLEAVLKSTGSAAGVTSEELQKQATALQSVTKFSDEAVMATQSMLLTFTNIKGGVMKEATAAALDMAQALGMDGAQAAMQLGKALNDPAAGLTKLQRIGVTFTDQQKKQVEAMVAAGNTAGAQKVILQELQKEFGGSAEAAGGTFAGKLTILKNTFGDLQETVGKAIVDALIPLADAFSRIVGDMQEAGGVVAWLKDKFEENKGVIVPLVGAILMGLVPALLTAAGAMWAFMAPLIPWLAAGAILAVLADKLADKMGGWSVVLGKIKDYFQLAQAAVSIFFETFGDGQDMLDDGGFADTVENIALKVKATFEAIKDTVMAVWGAIKGAISFLAPSIKALAETFVSQLLPAIWGLINVLAPILLPILKVVGAVLGVMFVAAIWVAINVLNLIIGVISWFINILTSIIGVVSTVVGVVINYLQLLYNFWSTIFMAIFNVVKFVFQLILVAIATVISLIMAVVQPIGEFLAKPFRWAFDVIRSVWGGITGFFGDIGNRIGNVASGIKDKLTAPFSAAVEFVKGIPGKMVDAISNIGKLIRDKLGDWDIPGPLGKVKDVIPGFATGVRDFSGGMAWVGERGPELVNLPKGADVFTADQSRRMAGSSTTNQFYGNITIANEAAANAFFDRLNRDSEMTELTGVPI